MIEKSPCYVWKASLPTNYDTNPEVIDGERGTQPSCRAFRLVKDSMRFLFLKVPRKYPDDALRVALRNIIRNGVIMRFELGSMRSDRNRYLMFEFLGFTESGIKSGQIILLQKTVVSSGDVVPSPNSLLQKFGDLQDVFDNDGPGKYVARLGLSFSSTVESVNPSPSEVVQISDLKAKNGVLTTDGCGIIREAYAKAICSRHNFDSSTSVFQIRKGGIKGVLVAYPDVKFDEICRRNRLNIPNEYKVAYRPSMHKYHGGPTHIEIQGISEPARSARLSLSIIIILMSLGVGLQRFKALLRVQLRSIDMIAYDRKEAFYNIEGELDAQGDSFHQELYELLCAGHSLNDAYLRKKLRECQRIQYENLRQKLNIRVPKSCYVYGVVDELGVLADHEVYIQLPQREGIIVSDVLIARHPSYKPSDIRLLRAVDKPELRFLTNCIVFPQRGRFSIPGSMSGGDLDGDMYFVCWEPTIFPLRTKKPPPPSPGSNVPKTNWKRRDLNEALVDLFVEQHHSKLIGFAASEWQSIVEKYRYLAGARYPKKLAVIIEEALDILKNGGSYKALWDRYFRLCSEYRIESRSIRRRRSNLYTIRRLIPDIREDKEIYYEPDPDLSLRTQRPQAWDMHYNEGKRLIKLFNKGLANAIHKDEDDREEDDSDEPSRRRTRGDLSHADMYKTRFIDKYFPRSPGILSEGNITSYVRASAWYYVGYEEQKPTFAWLGARFLHNIKSYETNDGRPGMSIGALKKPQASESLLIDPDLPYWHYDRRVEEEYSGDGRKISEKTVFYATTVARVHLDDD